MYFISSIKIFLQKKVKVEVALEDEEEEEEEEEEEIWICQYCEIEFDYEDDNRYV